MNAVLVILSILEFVTRTVAICGMIPPVVVSSHQKELHFTDGISLTLECNGTGNPRPFYSWFKDGEYVHAGSKYKLPNLSRSDQGIYICRAFNGIGVALSPPTRLIRGFSQPPPVQDPTIHAVNPGDSLQITCNFGISVPSPRISWVVKTQLVDPNPQPIRPSERIYFDQEGKLYITNVILADAVPRRYYQCQAYNFVTDTVRGGTFSVIHVRGVQEGHTPPIILHASSFTLDAVVGESIKIRCVFGGNPTPEITWTKVGGSLPRNHRILDFKRTLELFNFQETSPGKYSCRGTNSEGYFSLEFTIIAKISPTWEERPQNQVVDKGVDVIIKCKARGNPKIATKWYMNGTKLDDDTLGPRRTILPDGSLNISKTDITDTATYQCNASNIYGYLFGQVYLKVRCGTLPTLLCPRGFVMNEQLRSCYKVVPSALAVSWFQAEQFCRLYATDRWSKDVHLVSIESEAENSFVSQQIQRQSALEGQSIWTSGNSIDTSTGWTWARTLQNIIYNNWSLGHPGSNQHCLALDAVLRHKWVSKGCASAVRGFVCESTLIRIRY